MVHEHPNLSEFKKNAPYDGMVFIHKDKIIKIKSKYFLTVDLRYDANNKVFLDASGNVYKKKISQYK